MTATARQHASPNRRAMLAKVHLAAKELGLDDDARRDVIERVTGGHRSSSDCTDAQLDLVVAEFRRLGFRPRPAAQIAGRQGRVVAEDEFFGQAAPAPAPRRTPATTPVALKARAMWKSLWNLGAVRNGSEAALEAFGKRQLHVDRLQWADPSQAFRLIEALKAMAEREGWSQDMTGVSKGQEILSLKRRLVQRQAELLGQPPYRLHDMTEAQLDRLAAGNGPAVRAARGLE